MKKNVVNFDVSQDYYITKAIDYEGEGDLINAVSMIKRAIDLQDDLFLSLKLAAYYENMGDYSDACDIYIQIIATKGPVMHCFYSLFDNMMYLGNDIAAAYYATQYSNLSYSEEEKQDLLAAMQKHVDVLMKKDYEEVPRWVKLPKSKYFAPGISALAKNKFPEAIAHFLSVPIESQDGLKALEGIMHAYRSMNNKDMAQTYADKILELDNVHQNALMEKLRFSIEAQDTPKYEEYLQQIITLNLIKEKDVMFITYELSLLGQYEPAIYILKKYLTEYPYSKDVKYRYGAICYNEGYYDLAFEQFSDIVKISDPFGIATYHRNVCVKHLEKHKKDKPKRRIEVYPSIPESEVKRRCDYVIECIAAMQTYSDPGSLEEIWRNSRFKTALSYSLEFEQKMIVYGALPLLLDFECPSKAEFFEDLLRSVSFGDRIKRELLYQYAKKLNAKKVSFAYDGVLCEIKLDKDVKNYPQVFKDAYAYFVFILSPISQGFEKQLKKVMRTLLSDYKLKNLEYEDEKSLAAFFALNIEFIKKGVSQSEVCELFECKSEVLEKYKKELSI